MNERTTVAVVLSLVALAAGATGTWLALDTEPAGPSAVEAAEPGSDADEIALLRDQVAAQGEALERLSMQIAALSDERRAARAFDDAPAPAGGDEATAAGADAGARAPATDAEVEARIADLLAGRLDDGASWEPLESLVGTERLEALVEQLAANAEANASDPEAQYMLGMGYIAQLQGGATNMQMGVLAMKADAAFDDALGLDEEHLGARKAKAISLSFYPPIMGKRAEAVQQFETLIAKQKNHPVQDDFAENYALLANLHAESGDLDSAIAVLENGLEHHPENADLTAQLAGLANDE